MKKSMLLTLIPIVLFASPMLYAALPINVDDVSLQTLKKRFHIDMPVPGATNPVVKATNSLRYVRERTDENQVVHVRMQQVYFGFPVFRGYAILHSSNPSDVLLDNLLDVRMNGTVYQGLEEEIGRPPKDFIKHGTIVLEKFKANYKNAILTEEEVIPTVYIDEDNHAFWAYHIGVKVEYEDAIPERPNVIIDAKTHVPFVNWNDLKTAQLIVKGAGFGGNTRMRKYEFGQNKPYLLISRDSLNAFCTLENDNTKVIDMGHRFRGAEKVMRFECSKDKTGTGVYLTGYKQDGYDLENGAYSPSNDALYIGEVISDMYTKWFGIPPLSKGNKPIKLNMRVHYGKKYQNAFWDGVSMTFGDGGDMLHPLVSIGVGAHEISHGFTQQHSNLVYFGQSGGLNESFSDMAAQAAEYYAKRSNNWKIGAEILKKNADFDAIRYMDKPSRDGASIDSALDYRKGMDVHYSSGVFNRLFYLLATKPGWNTRKAFTVMVKANLDYWTPYSNFDEAGCGVLNAAAELQMPIEDIKQALTEVAVNHVMCNVQL